MNEDVDHKIDDFRPPKTILDANVWVVSSLRAAVEFAHPSPPLF